MTKVDDLIILAADKDMQLTLEGVMARPRSLGIRPITYKILVHIDHDPGCWKESHDFLRGYINLYRYALVLFDYEGSGQESKTVENLQTALEDRLEMSGWKDRARVIILKPELEIWVWSNSPHVDECLGWAGQKPDLRTWLREQGLLAEGEIKPTQPKAAMEQALRIASKPRSAAIYKQLAEKVSFKGCIDPAFNRLCSTLQAWFSS